MAAPSDRIDHAWHWLQGELAGAPVPALLVFIGLRDGAVLDALEKHAPGRRVVALEPDAQQARTFLRSDTWAAWRTSGRLAYLSDPDYVGADEAWRMFPSGVTVPTVVIHPEMALTDGVARASQRLKQILFGIEANAAARRRFAPPYLANSIRNLPGITHGADVRQLTDAYCGTPAIVVAAGPSLDTALPVLQAQPGRGLLIAADTALRPLLAADVTPDLVVGLDPGAMNARHFLSLPECAHTWLVSESALDPRAAAHFGDRTFWFRVSNHHPWPWFNELGVDVGRVDVWGSVLTAAFQVACLAGCDPIVIVGADLAFTDGRPYARGTTYEFDWAWGAAGETSLSDSWRAATEKGQPAPDLRGGSTQTTRSMTSVRDWMTARASRSGRRVINASGAGTLFGEGIELAALTGILPAGASVRPMATVASRRRTVVPLHLEAAVRKVQEVLASGQQTPLIEQWRDFCGGVLATESVATALDDAAERLEGRTRARSSRSVIRWGRPAATVLGPLLTHLPEALAAQQLGLLAPSACAVAPAGPADGANPTDRAQRLLAAWDLLEGVAHTVLQAEDDLPLALDATQVGHARACNLYAWPEPVRWAVLLFEGLLAEADAAARLPTNTDVARPVLPGRAAGPIEPNGHPLQPNAQQACALLVLDWLRSAGASPELYRPIAEQLHEEAVARATGRPVMPARAALTISVARDGEADSLRLSLDGWALARFCSGILRESCAGHRPTPHAGDLADLVAVAAIDDRALSVAIATRAIPRDAATAGNVRRGSRVIPPRILTSDAGISRLFVGYPTRDGVVCVRPHTRESVIVDARGTIRPHRMWPRAIGVERPFGDGGAVAWSNGLSRYPEIEPAYVMYQGHSNDAVTTEELPVRPAYGNWWRGRLYLTCYSHQEGWQGVVSWAPGEGVREEFPGVTAWSVLPDEEVLTIHPCDFSPKTGFARRRRSEAFVIRPDQTREPVALGPHGAASSRDHVARWTAIAYPVADLVEITAAAGESFLLTCYCPLGVAWAGRSLIVSTLQGELLLWERLLDVLDAAPSSNVLTGRARHA